MDDDRKLSEPRFVAPISELMVVSGIVSFLWLGLVPVVNAARDSNSEPPILPSLGWLYDGNPAVWHFGGPILCMLCTSAFLVAVRRLLPVRYRSFIQWSRPESPPPEPIVPKLDSRPAVFSFSIAILSVVLGAFAASHLRADRTNRRPIITWDGPFGEQAQVLWVVALCFSVGAIVAGALTIHRYRSGYNGLAVVGILMSVLHCFGSCVFYVALTED